MGKMRNIWTKYWPYLVTVLLWAVIAVALFSCIGCNRSLKKENEQLREELARQQQYVPLKRDTIRDTVEVVTQKVVEVEKVKEVLTKEDKELLKDLGTKVSAIESFQKIGMMTQAEVKLSSDAVAANTTEAVAANDTDAQPKEREPPVDSVLVFKDAWLDLKYNTINNNLLIQLRDSLAISVEKEYKRKFLWWRWGTKGYQVKAVSFNPYSTIRYNTYVKRKR